jgi:hypothetical protein
VIKRTDVEDGQRQKILTELLGGIGKGSWIMPRLRCDYGYLIRLGDNSFLNYDAIVMDCAPVTIGNDVSIGPRAQLLTALHPMEDHEARRRRWESAAPITIGDNVWMGGGVIVSWGDHWREHCCRRGQCAGRAGTRMSGEEVCDGVDRQPGQRTDHGAVDPDELQVPADL